MTYLKDSVQKSVVDGGGGADGSISKEEGSKGGEDSVGQSDGAINRQVKPDVRAHVGRRERLHRGQRRPAGEDVTVSLGSQLKVKRFYIEGKLLSLPQNT